MTKKRGFEVLEVLFRGLKTSPISVKSFMDAEG
jgi:hypothetical protein